MRPALLFLALGLLAACTPRTVTLTRSRLLMGHVPVNLSLRIPPERRTEALEAGEGAYRLAQTIEARISEYQAGSDLSCLNRTAGKAPCPLDPTTRGLLARSFELGEATGHAFDIRFGSPTAAGRSGQFRNIDATHGRLENSATRLGIGAIGKGWIVDRMIDYLASRGFREALIDAGGDLRAAGGPWRVAIQVPEAVLGTTTPVVAIRDRAMATSGLYEQGPHILDPHTGKTVQRRGSVTVEAADLTLADALATGFFVMGEEKSREYLQRFPGVAMTWTDPDGTTRRYAAGSDLKETPLTPSNKASDDR